MAVLKKLLSSEAFIIAAISIAFGGSGVLGYFKFFVERPLIAENSQLKNRLIQAELDEKEQQMVITNHQTRIEALELELGLAKSKDDQENVARIQAELLSTSASLKSTLRKLSDNLAQARASGSRWFNSGNAARAYDYSKQAIQTMDMLDRKIDDLD
ncbi:hypothetical protein RG677_002605 [Vibrio parahaemolyticus]|uniref:hypothetical protein n=2 Tax=Vibrio parahaemolyticus TaxID=670 RepID=UPI00111FB474|nr:hypothetical protein [Vibrio parahaemolyticus]EGQ7811097.1 hypothetical protein [Vibrio parahaemolyticus]EGQ8536706.1 hypothetical protein [Vibrio parahaemolyticus]EHD0108244.1 hypothetical protein [Vibrio parahaemolyticus]EIV8651447.1 hypothetical protein [Vibrio parahaemolyticus]EJB8572648.1 hypothetical protein [Vibrio parahaemolyticus]